MKIFQLKAFILINIIIYLIAINSLKSEPLIVLEYATSKDINDNITKNSEINENSGKYYNVKKNESLSGIVEKFYGNMSLNLNPQIFLLFYLLDFLHHTIFHKFQDFV